MTFFSHHPLLHGIYVIYCLQLPFYLVCVGAPHQIQSHFSLIPTKKCLEKILVALGGAPAPPEPLAYAYGVNPTRSTPPCYNNTTHDAV